MGGEGPVMLTTLSSVLSMDFEYDINSVRANNTNNHLESSWLSV